MLPRIKNIMTTSATALPAILLSTVLTAFALPVWALPTFNAPPPPYQGKSCRVAQSQAQREWQPPQASFESRRSPCRLEDAEAQKGAHLNEGEQESDELTRKGEDVDVVARLRLGQEAAPGSAAIAMAPVPEPATYAMLLGGLGLIAVLRRRKAQPAARR